MGFRTEDNGKQFKDFLLMTMTMHYFTSKLHDSKVMKAISFNKLNWISTYVELFYISINICCLKSFTFNVQGLFTQFLCLVLDLQPDQNVLE